jgi:hypothetical protein
MIIPFALLMLAGCSGDSDNAVGNWEIREMKIGGRMMYSDEKKELDRLFVDYRTEKDPNLTFTTEQVTVLREVFDREMDMVSRMTMDIKDDGSFVSVRYQGTTPVETKGKLVFDEEKGEVTMKSDIDEKLEYVLDGDELTFKNSEAEVTYKRK